MKNIDTSDLTPEQLANAELMQEYTRTHEFKASINDVNLAERILPGFVAHQSPETAFKLALEYAGKVHALGEVYLQNAFENWKASRPTEPAPPPEELDLDDPDVHAETLTDADAEAVGNPFRAVEPTETITRDAAVADTERRAYADTVALKPVLNADPNGDYFGDGVELPRAQDQVEATARGIEPTGH